MAGALTERDFVEKLDRAGFRDIEVLDRRPIGVDVCALYPLFTDEVLDLMRSLLPPATQSTVATAAIVSARLP